ncbi:MAG TPA: exo-alpha-sialidase [Candidatus Mediterraneibacter merdigallinarum]|nr:exo-alpha-sialidase [Candidatus Mediterraneibacter merdigallinarum]
MKKTKKRFLALLLTLTMVLSMGMQTFAVGTDSESDIQTQDIQTETETGTEDNTADVPDSSEGQDTEEAATSEDDGAAVQSDESEPAVRSNVSDKPADGTTSGQPFAAGTGGSQNFRIPAIVTLDDGTIIAAADARWNTSADAGGLDTIVSRSSDNGANWNYTFANYLGDNGNAYVKESATFIDPALATDGSTIYMLADLFPGGVALNSSNQKPEAAAAFDEQGQLKLAQSGSSDYSYYLGEFENGRAQIFGADGNAVEDYTVDEYFNLYQGDVEVSNLFFSDSPYQVVKTSYLYLTKSTDKGATWSAPTLINVKADDEQFYGVGPGTGIVTSDGTILFSAYEWNGTDSSQRSSFIYSTDGGETWERTENATGGTWSSENQLVELNDGTIRMFFRNGSNQICYVDATGNADEGYIWGSIMQTEVSNNSNCQISALKYSQTINGKEAILLSCPTDSSWGSRSAGKIFVGLVNDDGTMDFNSFSATAVTNGTFQYSCLTELSDGSVGLLYENGSASIQYTNFQIENLAKDAQIGDPDPGFVSEDGTLINSLNFAATDREKTVEFRGLSDSQYLTVTTSSETVATAKADGSSVTVTPVGAGTATITATVQTNSRSVEDGSQYELTVTVSGVDEAYTGSITQNPGGTSYVLDTDGIDNGGQYLIVYDGHALENTDGETSTGDRDVTVSGNEVTNVNESNDDHLLWTFEGSGDRFTIRNTNAYIYLHYERSGWSVESKTLDTTEQICLLDGSNGRYTIYGSNRYLHYNSGFMGMGEGFEPSNTASTVSLYRKTTEDPSWSTDLSKLQEQINAANDLTADNYTTDSWNVLQDAVEAAESLSSSEYSSESEAQAAQNTIDQAAQRIAEAIAALQRKPFTEELSVAVGQSISVTVDGTMTQGPDETFATAVIDGNTMTITGVAAGTTTVVVGAGTYNITVTEIPDGDFSNIGDLSFVSNTGDTTYSRGKTVSHLILTPGISYDLNLNGADGYNVTWKSENASIATVGQNGTVTGVTPGETVVIAEITDEEGNIVGRHSATVTVLDIEPIYENSRPSDNGERIVEIYVNEIQDSRLYYVQNDEGEYKEVFADTAIYISTEAAWAMTFFGAPVDENYALTYMSAANNLDQTNWYAIQDYSNMRQTTFFQNKGSLNNEDTHLYTDNEIIAMLQGAKELGADGGFWFTRGTDATNSCQAIINVISERLPSLEKSIKSVIHSGETVDYTEGMQIYPGDTLVYDITVHRYETEYGIVYSNAQLRELLSGAEFSDGTTSKNITSDLGTSGDPAPARDFLYEAEYTVRDSDLDSMITNTVSLSYGYRAAYSTGELTAEAEAVAEVSVLTFDPDDYIIDFGSPITVDFTGKTSYNFVSGSANFGTVQTNGMEVTYTPNAVLTEADTVRITNERGAVYTFTVYPASSVYYEEGFASYDGSWSPGSAVTENQTVSVADDETVDLYGYDDLYASANGNSNNTAAVSSTKNGTATFTFNGTGLDIYALTTQSSGSMSLWLYEGEGTDGTLLKLGYVDTANNWLEENNGNYYNTPVFSYKDLTAGTYTVKIIVNSGEISLDGFRVYHTQGDAYESVYAADQEDQALTAEVRDITIAGSTYDLADIDDWYKYGENIISAVYDASNNGSGAVILGAGNEVTADADMINNGPKNEIYLKSGQTIAMRLTASAYDKVAVGMRSLNSGTVSYQINDQPESTLSSTVDMYYEVEPNDGMIVIENRGENVLALTKIKVTNPVYEAGGASLFTIDADTMAFALQCIADETETVETADAALTVNVVDANGNAVAETVLTANGTVGETHTFAAADIQTVAEGILPEGYELTDAEYSDVEVAYGESESVEFSASEAEAEEPEGSNDEGFFTKLGNAIKSVVNTVTDFFKSLFSW